MTPRPFRVVSRKRETRDTWTLELEPVAGQPLESLPGQFTMLYAFGVAKRRSRSRPKRRPARAHGARRRRGQRGDLRRPTRRRARRARAVRERLAARGLRRRRSRDRRRRDRARAAARRRLRRARPRAQFQEVAVLYGSRTPTDLLFVRELERWRRAGLKSRSPSTAPGPTGVARSAWSGSSSPTPASIRSARPACSAGPR